jgi:hypothetical protein
MEGRKMKFDNVVYGYHRRLKAMMLPKSKAPPLKYPGVEPC